MSEEMIDGILGEEERPEMDGQDVAAMVDSAADTEPFAAAITHHAAIYSPEVARDASVFLQVQARHVEVQSRLVQVQTTLLKDEHDLRLTQMRNQLSEGTLRRFGLRLRVSFQLFLACAATVIGECATECAASLQ